MSLEAILENIRASGKEEIAAIQSNAKAEAEKILKEAQIRAKEIIEQTLEDEFPRANRERARILQQARLEALQITELALHDQVEEVIKSAQQQISSMRSDPRYPDIFSTLVREALDELKPSLKENEIIHLLADPRDEEVLTELLKQLPANIEPIYCLECWGGITAASQDEKVRIINTLDARLRRATPYLQQHITAQFKKHPAES